MQRKTDPFNENLKAEFIEHRSRVNKLINKTKNEFYRKKLNECRGDLKKTWNLINEVTSAKRQVNQINAVQVDGSVIKDQKEVAQYLNKYFANVAQHLASNIPEAPPLDLAVFRQTVINETIFLYPANEDEVIKIIKCLNPSNSLGPEGLSANQ